MDIEQGAEIFWHGVQGRLCMTIPPAYLRHFKELGCSFTTLVDLISKHFWANTCRHVPQ